MQNNWMETQMIVPIPDKDYPQTWNEFLDWFGTEEACLAGVAAVGGRIRLSALWQRR